jgi:hypothetical protein
LIYTDNDIETVLDTPEKQAAITKPFSSEPRNCDEVKPRHKSINGHHHQSHHKHSKSVDFNSSRGEQASDAKLIELSAAPPIVLDFFKADGFRQNQEHLQNITVTHRQQSEESRIMSGGDSSGTVFVKESDHGKKSHGSRVRSQEIIQDRILGGNEDTWTLCGVKLSKLCNNLLGDESDRSKLRPLLTLSNGEYNEEDTVSVGKLIQFFNGQNKNENGRLENSRKSGEVRVLQKSENINKKNVPEKQTSKKLHKVKKETDKLQGSANSNIARSVEKETKTTKSTLMKDIGSSSNVLMLQLDREPKTYQRESEPAVKDDTDGATSVASQVKIVTNNNNGEQKNLMSEHQLSAAKKSDTLQNNSGLPPGNLPEKNNRQNKQPSIKESQLNVQVKVNRKADDSDKKVILNTRFESDSDLQQKFKQAEILNNDGLKTVEQAHRDVTREKPPLCIRRPLRSLSSESSSRDSAVVKDEFSTAAATGTKDGIEFIELADSISERQAVQCSFENIDTKTPARTRSSSLIINSDVRTPPLSRPTSIIINNDVITPDRSRPASQISNSPNYLLSSGAVRPSSRNTPPPSFLNASVQRWKTGTQTIPYVVYKGQGISQSCTNLSKLPGVDRHGSISSSSATTTPTTGRKSRESETAKTPRKANQEAAKTKPVTKKNPHIRYRSLSSLNLGEQLLFVNSRHSEGSDENERGRVLNNVGQVYVSRRSRSKSQTRRKSIATEVNIITTSTTTEESIISQHSGLQNESLLPLETDRQSPKLSDTSLNVTSPSPAIQNLSFINTSPTSDSVDFSFQPDNSANLISIDTTTQTSVVNTSINQQFVTNIQPISVQYVTQISEVIVSVDENQNNLISDASKQVDNLNLQDNLEIFTSVSQPDIIQDIPTNALNTDTSVSTVTTTSITTSLSIDQYSSVHVPPIVTPLATTVDTLIHISPENTPPHTPTVHTTVETLLPLDTPTLLSKKEEYVADQISETRLDIISENRGIIIPKLAKVIESLKFISISKSEAETLRLEKLKSHEIVSLPNANKPIIEVTVYEYGEMNSYRTFYREETIVKKF